MDVVNTVPVVIQAPIGSPLITKLFERVPIIGYKFAFVFASKYTPMILSFRMPTGDCLMLKVLVLNEPITKFK